MQDLARYWNDVLSRNRQADGHFFYAVRSTGVFCRPSCPSRRPRRQQVEFFATSELAESAGYRACKRCDPKAELVVSKQVELVKQICEYLDQADALPSLEDLANRFHLSQYHLQRTFKRLVGVSPRQYAEARRLERLRKNLRGGESVTESIFGAGYNSASSVYQRSSSELGMTPSEYKTGGRNVEVSYKATVCPLGTLVVATTGKGVCAVVLASSEESALAKLVHEFPAASIQKATTALLEQSLNLIARYCLGEQVELDLPLDLTSTAFQRRVWELLRAIPYGETLSYGELAEKLGQPGAARAVARACATNPAALVIPCHRVVRTDGALGGYRWGLARKETLLKMERKQL